MTSGPVVCTVGKLWSGQELPENEHITVKVDISHDQTSLVISVDAPFYNDAKPGMAAGEGEQESSANGLLRSMSVDGLWNYEVVEVFIKGRSDKYVEVEMGPHGHYLILACDGYRQCFNRGIHPLTYTASISEDGSRWSGKLVCPLHLLPPPADIPSAEYSLNAYGIHGTAEDRVYAVAYGPPQAEGDYYAVPDFHKLELFQHLPAAFCARLKSAVHLTAEESVWGDRPFLTVSAGVSAKGSIDMDDSVDTSLVRE